MLPARARFARPYRHGSR